MSFYGAKFMRLVCLAFLLAHLSFPLALTYAADEPAIAPIQREIADQTATPTAAAKTTLENLQTAFNGESNAHARYLAFATKADQEGFKAVASLFRAAAAAEDIHAKRHAKVIRKIGGSPVADIQKPDVKTTKENLEAAMKGETYEKDVMYPEFLMQAKLENNRRAAKAFRFALSAEAEHAKLYAEALNAMDAWKDAPKTFYVCNECGFTTTVLPDPRCPICGNLKKNFLQIA